MNLLEYFYRGTGSGEAPPQAPATRIYLEKAGYSVRCGFAIYRRCSGILDRPLEPVIGRRFAPTRWRTMTAECEG